MRACLVLYLALLAHPALAADVESVTVAHDDGVYKVSMSVLVDVPAAAAYAVMTDFENLPEVNQSVVFAERLPGNRLHTKVDMCITVFCRSIEQTQQVKTSAPDTLRMTVIPQLSDFSFGVAQWRFMPVTAHSSRLFFNAQLQPDFWIPPLIGPWLVKNKLQQEAQITSSGIERVAHARGY